MLLHHLPIRMLLAALVAGCAAENVHALDPVAEGDPTDAREPQTSDGSRSNDDANGATPPDPDSSSNGDAGDGGTAPACKDLDTSLQAYAPVSNEPGTPPLLQGGTIVPGTYTYSGSTSYVVIGNPPPPDPQRRGLLEVGASSMTEAVEPGPGTAHSVTVSYSVVAGGISVTPQCLVLESGTVEQLQGAEPRVIAYSATPTTIVLRLGGIVSATTDSSGNTVVTDESVEDYVFTR